MYNKICQVYLANYVMYLCCSHSCSPHVSVGGRTDSRVVKWDDQHAIQDKVKVHTTRTGKRDAVATRTFVVLAGDGLVLGIQQRIGNSIKETSNLRHAIHDRHKGAQVSSHH